MSGVLIHNARILTLAEGSVPRRGAEARNLSVIERGYIRCEGTTVTHLGAGCPSSDATQVDSNDVQIDAHGRVVAPAFIDAHTHACFAGDRLDEWDLKRHGASYLDILSAGGGIMSTVRAVRSASPDHLVDLLTERVCHACAAGSAVIEVKSGYGLDTETELKMLRAIRAAAATTGADLVPTALLGHAIDPDRPGFVDRTIDETLPAIAAEFPGVTIDAYCEVGAWSVEDCRRLFECALSLGMPIRVHADQFNALGMTPLAVEMGARSVDHLEASTEADLKALAESETFGVMLPACGFHLDDRYADGRRFIDFGGSLVIASNFNPGSAPCFSMPFVIALAVRKLGLTIEEAISACTVNAAALLGSAAGTGILRVGAPASIVMLRHRDERALAFEFGGDPVDLVITRGVIRRNHADRRGIIYP